MSDTPKFYWNPYLKIEQLERELAKANNSITQLMEAGVAKDFENQAHKAALEKCEEAILELNEGGGYLTAGDNETCCNCGHVNGHDEGCIQPLVDEALAAIKQLKQQ